MAKSQCDYWTGVLQRIEQQLAIDEELGCWVWLGRSSRNGYGRISMRGLEVQVHRVLFSIIFGPIPKGQVLDHLCKNRSCVKPTHMEPVTVRENTLRGDSPAAKRYWKGRRKEMSVTFTAEGLEMDLDDEETFLNVHNSNARDLLLCLGINLEVMCGSMRSNELRERIAIARTKEDNGRDYAKEWWKESGEIPGNLHLGQRPPGHMGRYLDTLDKFCEAAGDIGMITWG